MRERSKMPMLLTELTIMILVFAICAAVCLSVFASARSNAIESRALSAAASWAQSAAEAYSAAGGDSREAARLLGAEATEDGFSLSLSSDWHAAEGGEYLLELSGAEGEATVSVFGSGGVCVFSLDVKAVTYG